MGVRKYTTVERIKITLLLRQFFNNVLVQWARRSYIKGARIWIPNTETVWEGAQVTADFVQNKLQVLTDSGEAKELQIATEENLPPLRNPEILIGGNDLTSLSYLHEPAVLHNLQVRFCRENAIYTYCGIVLVAINPYKEMDIYGSDTIWTYRGRAMGELEPHIFAVAEEAYTKMEREQTDQSIIVSGESGAGKTVSAKYAMRYFATVGGSTTETHVEKKVLASSPIMEAIGNAKTIRNDNSSRFGKYIELHFTRSYTISGASMRTYLLEKSRVVFQAPNERNYHIFYQLCSARSNFPELGLEQAKEYNYLKSESKIPGVDDGLMFGETTQAFNTLGFTSSDTKGIFTLLAAILHLGNIGIFPADESDSETCDIPPNDGELELFCKLLEVKAKDLRKWLCNRQLVSSRETLEKPMNAVEACGARDALAKHMYAVLFSWIVDVINKALKTGTDSRHRFIGVLDIYGFETFESNSFEQFCINYANEKLQQQFNQHVFKLEQEEYYKEDIEWKFIDFYDNQPCIDLIESKLGVLDLLDEECRMPRGSDSSWVEKLNSKCSKWNHFAKARFGQCSSFIIRHFADRVDYDAKGFLEKNRDTVIEEQVEVLRCSSSRFIQNLFREPEGENADRLSVPKAKVRVSAQVTKPTSTGTKNKKTVGSQFRDSLNALMKTLNSTTPHYIRCIKPNDEKTPFRYNPCRAVQQLRACGVLETIRISAAGFPSRWLYGDFLKRYRALIRSKSINRDDMKASCAILVSNVIKDVDKYKLGKTKLFFRAGQVAYLERLRSERLLECCIIIQTAVRGFLCRRRYTRTLTATSTLQRYFRGYLARKRVENLRKNAAAVKIQKVVRGWVKRTQYRRLKATAIGLQKFGRGYLARKKYLYMQQNSAAIVIQKHVRGWLARVNYRRTLKKIVIIQTVVKGFLARRKFKKMKREARSAEHIKQLNKGLENKIFSLKQKLDEMTKENQHLQKYVHEVSDMKVKLEELRGVEQALKKLMKEGRQREEQMKNLQGEISHLKDLVLEKDNVVGMIAKENDDLSKENTSLKTEIQELRNNMVVAKNNQEEEIRKRIELELKRAHDEFVHERMAHQKLIAEKDNLEALVESLQREKESKLDPRSHKRNLSDMSNASTQEEDFGYSSVKSPTSSVRDSYTPTPEMDIGLVCRLQQKLRVLESENHRLHTKVDQGLAMGGTEKQKDTLLLQELEIENAKLKSDLNSLRECITNDATNSGDTALQEIMKQLRNRENEAIRLREENIQLRKTFTSQTQSTKNLVETSYSGVSDLHDSLINEDGELVQAYEAQKKVIRQQAEELESKTTHWDIEREELTHELERLRTESDKHRLLLSSAISNSSDTFLQHEVARISTDYLELQERYEKKSEKCRQLQRQVIELTSKLKEAGVNLNSLATMTAMSVRDRLDSEFGPSVKKRDRILGMFEFDRESITVLLKHLTALNPTDAISLLPCLPAYILFMCVRYTDHVNNDRILQALILGFERCIKRIVRNKTTDIDTLVLWLSNTVRFSHNLKQYGGEDRYAKENTQTQNEQCLNNFDLSEFGQLLDKLIVLIIQEGILKYMQNKVKPLAVPAILEAEAIQGLTFGTSRARSQSTASATSPVTLKAMEELEYQLTSFLHCLSVYVVDIGLTNQLFKQLYYFLCATALNNLLLRKELCHWSRGMQIRYNLSHLEQWARDKLTDPSVYQQLTPIVQASQLLQAKKSDEFVQAVADMSSALTSSQIVKLLNLYTPADDYEERVPASFIGKIQEYLKENRKEVGSQSLLMDTKFVYPVEIVFNPSKIRLEDVDVPPILNLPMLKKI